MTSVYPIFKSTDMLHMYDNPEERCDKIDKYPNNSLMDILSKHEDFTIFYNLVKDTHYKKILSCIDYNYTLFVPSDIMLKNKYSEHFLSNIRKTFAIELTRNSIIDRIVDKKVLQSSKKALFRFLESTRNKVETVDDNTTINKCAKVIHWNHPAKNGIIHVTDNFIFT